MVQILILCSHYHRIIRLEIGRFGYETFLHLLVKKKSLHGLLHFTIFKIMFHL